MIRFAPLPALACALAMSVPANAQQLQPAAQASSDVDATYRALDADFKQWMQDNHVPGLVWGVVRDGRLVHVRAMGVQAAGDDGLQVSTATGFRIASMSKAFTAYAILILRDEGKLRLDDPAWKYVPEMKSWAADVTVADLLHHTAGFVTDDPWGDRQQVMPEAEFTVLLKAGVPRTAERGTRYEYSNFGYATLGRIVSNVSGMNYSQFIAARVFAPLGMTATTYENRDVPVQTRAKGYRWEDAGWREEPAMRHGAFGAMGGITTSADDYAKWLAHLLSAWPARSNDGARSTVRAMQYGGGLPQLRNRPGKSSDCKVAGIYAAGLIAGQDCVLGQVLFHGGGFPGYGSHMLLLPDAGIAVFALTNRTYSGPSGPVWDAATRLVREGHAEPRGLPLNPALETAYGNARRIWSDGGLQGLPASALAMNFTMDRDAAHWASYLSSLKSLTGVCEPSSTPIATGALSLRFSWSCTNGALNGNLLLAPDKTPRIQSLVFDFVSR
jgi:D-alanyl-D-alanine-carboxypeptidase/D-alanyl-D-alanine-endopeptidase